MSREYEENMENPRERRSRRNPRMRDGQQESGRKQSGESGLKVMGDASVHPVSSGSRSAEGTKRRTAAAPAAAKTARGSAGGSGLTPRQERALARRKKRRRIIAMIIAECLTLVLIFGYGYVLRLSNQIQRPEFNESEIKNNDLAMDTMERMKGYWTIAIFGVDARDKAIAKGTNADVNMICNINLDTGEIRLVSVFRDTYLNISKDGSYNKINQAYFLGGPEQAVAALNRNLDLDISDYMTFNWKAVADAINVLGGVDIELSKAEFYYINSFITETVKATGVGSQHLKSAGMNHLDGVQAVAYGRLRLMDTDYARTERQRKVIKQAFEKAKQADIETLNRVLATVFPQVATSINVNDIFVSLKMINRYHLGETTGFPQARGDARMGKKGAVVVPQTLESNVVKLHEFLFGDEAYTPSNTVKQISAKIAADSGMYKEGKYVDSVGTEGGVIQKPKETQPTKTAETSEEKTTASGDDKRYATIYVLDKNGKKVKKSVDMETDEDGEYIEPETNDAGLAIGWSLDKDGDLVKRETDEYGDRISESTAPEFHGRPLPTETDEEGNPIESNIGHGVRPGEDDDPDANAPGRPTAAETDAHGRPLSTETGGSRPGSGSETTGGLRPGFLDETEATRPTSGQSPSGSQNPTSSQSPSGNQSPSANYPGSSGGTSSSPHSDTAGSGTSQQPGGSTAPTSAPSAGGSGSGGTQPVQQFPGSSQGPGADSPSGSSNGSAIAPSGGAVSAPGQ